MIVAETPHGSVAAPEPTLPPAVEATDIGHAYRGRDGVAVDAIDGITLRVAPGELVALLGPSGCGKSTLLRILSGLIQPTHGTVTLSGSAPADARAAQGIGWLAQDDFHISNPECQAEADRSSYG